MRRDFHFHVIYVLCCRAGIKEDIAHKIAYASEHVDNQKDKHVLAFKNGGQTQTYRSAHKMLSRRMYTDKTGMSIYMPFHFFPSLEGHSFHEKIECKARSKGTKILKAKLLSHLKESYGPHILGVGLHVLADTHAHEGFNGLNDCRNKVRKLSLANDDFLNFVFKVKPIFLPPFGHLQALTCPDEPTCQWSYTNHMGQEIHRDNKKIYRAAIDEIYDYLCRQVFKEKPDWFDKMPGPLGCEGEQVYKMMDLNMSAHNRLQAWQRAWDLGLFGPMKAPNYCEEAWFNQAIDDKGIWIFKSYRRRKGYEKSDWKLFHDALAHHLFYCRHHIFTDYEIFI